MMLFIKKSVYLHSICFRKAFLRKTALHFLRYYSILERNTWDLFRSYVLLF